MTTDYCATCGKKRLKYERWLWCWICASKPVMPVQFGVVPIAYCKNCGYQHFDSLPHIDIQRARAVAVAA